ncbi:MAG: hypothetical protein K2G13_09040, partial [Muribaculaceae bacterium]|nr:hypothetical protein [Muribaculaceae bacterium]
PIYLHIPTKIPIFAFEKKRLLMEYTLTLQSQEDYLLIKKLLKAFDGASIRPQKDRYTIYDALEEVRQGKLVGPFHTTEELMKDLLN